MNDYTAQQESERLTALLQDLEIRFGFSFMLKLPGSHTYSGPFRLNHGACYIDSSGVLQVVVQSRVNGRWVDYMRHDAAYFIDRYRGRAGTLALD